LFKLAIEDICDTNLMSSLLEEEKPDGIFHLAAESHVDRSIDAPSDFIQTNVFGTFSMLEAARKYLSVNKNDIGKFRFLHVSTDEVYGSLGDNGYFTEDTPYAPNSPYSASKAASDHLARAWRHTYDMPALTANCSNNYGPRQFPEKLIPHIINSAIKGKPLPLYGDGKNVRDWLYVEDHCKALLKVMQCGKIGETYNIGGDCEKQNVQIVKTICSLLDNIMPKKDGAPYSEQITYVKDRPGHDRRYAIDASKIKEELGWRADETFDTGIGKTVRWYLENNKWVESILNGSYKIERIGLGSDGHA
jgi:dTDP-glucose 4,6-dehydratase